MRRILVINPNSNESVTEGLRQSLRGFGGRAVIDCCTIEDGPFGIESDEDVAAVGPLVAERIASSAGYDAYVIACYSDPGLDACRDRFDRPVYGMQQSAIETAVALGGHFGVLALSHESIVRHLAYIEKLGFSDRLAKELPLDITVDAAANDPATLEKVISTGQRLVDDFSVGSIILGCAGMAQIAEAAGQQLPVPVIEPTTAAVTLALG
jgi:Asp/Glu/hydantoin racemase